MSSWKPVRNIADLKVGDVVRRSGFTSTNDPYVVVHNYGEHATAVHAVDVSDLEVGRRWEVYIDDDVPCTSTPLDLRDAVVNVSPSRHFSKIRTNIPGLSVSLDRTECRAVINIDFDGTYADIELNESCSGWKHLLAVENWIISTKQWLTRMTVGNHLLGPGFPTKASVEFVGDGADYTPITPTENES